MVQTPSRGSRLRTPITALAMLLAAASAPAQDDTEFFQKREPPNVILSIDTSGSMITVVEHPFFDPSGWPFQRVDGTGVCDIIPDSQTNDNDTTDELGRSTDLDCGTFCRVQVESGDSGFVTTPDSSDDPNHGYLPRTFCGQTRKLWHDGRIETDQNDPTWYIHEYVEWLFSLDPSATYSHPDPNDSSTKTGQEILDEIDDAAGGRDYVTGDSYPLYQRTRIAAAKRVASEVMYRTNSDCAAFAGDCGVYQDRVRFGIARFRTDNNGGYVGVAPADYSANKSSLESFVDGLQASGSTPLGETLFHVYLYFLHRSDANMRPLGADGTRLPTYQFRPSDGEFTSTSSDWAADPWTAECQRQFVIVITDGAPNNDRFESSGSDNERFGFSEFPGWIGDYAPDLAGDLDWDPAAPTWTTSERSKEEGSPPWESAAGAGYLDDIARFMQQVDARGDFAGDQFVDVYTVGFRTAGAVNDLLLKTAKQGNGLAFLASDPTKVTEGLLAALEDINAKTQSFTSSTVPASRATDGNNFFASYFEPAAPAPFWPGHLKLFEFNAKGEIRDKPTPAQLANGDPGDCALEDPLAPGRCAVGRLRVELGGFWDAADELPDALTRRLYMSKFDSGVPTSTPVSLPLATGLDLTDVSNLSASDLGLSLADATSYDGAGQDITGIGNAEDLADAVQRYVVGCEFGSGSCVDRGDGRKLWDIFHSDPVVVGPPNRGLREPSYREFVKQLKHRKRVIYAGSNGGFVHGFNAGEYRLTNTADFTAAPGYDRGTGEETMGFMAYPIRQLLAELGREHDFRMDGSPVAGDVWLYPTPTSQPGDSTSLGGGIDDWEEWRTVLIGGLRQGGRVVWALDVTDPPDFDDTAGESAEIDYPGYLWEFPCESSDPQCVGGSDVPAGLGYADYMGETWSTPVITRVRMTVACTESDVSLCETFDRWVAIFGAGYDAAGDPNLDHESTPANLAVDEYDASHEAATSRAGRAIFMVDVRSGKLLAMKRFHHDSTEGNPDMKYAFPAPPAVFDLNRDGYADVVYIPDLGGQLWKWVITKAVPDPLHDVSGDIDQPEWPFLRQLAAESCGSGTPHFRSFYTAPTGALVGSSLWLALGSGERQDLDFVGTRDCERNRFYVLRDLDPLEREPASGRPFDDADLEDADNLSGSCNVALPSDKRGYYIEAQDGEKFVTDPVIFFGVVLAGSFVPDTTGGACSAAGNAFLGGFKLMCGTGVITTGGSGSTGTAARFVQVGTGLPSNPRVSVGPPGGGGGGGGGGGCTDMVVVLTSDGGALSSCPGGRPDSGIGLKTWRE